MDIHIYTPDFEFLHTIVNPKSVRWNPKYRDIGTLEIYVAPGDPAIPFFVERNELIIVQGNRSAWCNGAADDSGGFLICGRTLNWILNERMVEPFTMTGTPENIIRAKVADQLMTSGAKFVDGFIMAPPLGDGDTTTYATENMKSLLDITQELCSMDGMGFEVGFDYIEKKYIFQLYRGLDMTADQTDIAPVILSEINGNLTQTQYLQSNEGYASCGYIRQTDPDTQAVTYVEVIKDDLTGFYRREAALSAETSEDGIIELFKMNRTVEIEGDIVGVEFGVDFDLGDIVTLQKTVAEVLITQNRRVNEVVINQEVGNYSVTPILGEVD